MTTEEKAKFNDSLERNLIAGLGMLSEETKNQMLLKLLAAMYVNVSSPFLPTYEDAKNTPKSIRDILLLYALVGTLRPYERDRQTA